ncbi:hypothetical protein OMP38_25790 [Cohnella ginsengisoli]|uniref:Uncharacterized protein n=1 Tax=Cohnella ginsengisoli TaxID=425004 RepID=A0A9X4QPU4_9BACL|nr:hypothetical protein [Cohnella ginsengisoli]MDG0793852.1 hypothetical protein [Cohnella ginsengisoli]
MNRVVLFWLAFILTRPFGATFGDFLIKPHDKGGLGLQNGTQIASGILLAVLIVCIVIEYAKPKSLIRSTDTAAA